MTTTVLSAVTKRQRVEIGKAIMEQADLPVLFPLEVIAEEVGLSHQRVHRILCETFYKMAVRAREQLRDSPAVARASIPQLHGRTTI